VPGALKGRRVASDGVYVEREASLTDSAAAGTATLDPNGRDVPANGGFPEPPPGGIVRVVRAEHEACGHATRVRLPAQLAPAAVRRVVCQGCAETYDAPHVEEVELVVPDPDATRTPVSHNQAMLPAALATSAAEAASAPRRRLLGLRLPAPPPLPAWLKDPRSLGWRLVSIPLAAAAVIGGLLLIQGDSNESPSPFAGAVPAANESPAGQDASLVQESSFSLALPPRWKRTGATGGATFAATSPRGDADVTLWVERDPGLAFAEFETRSLKQLKSLAGSARVTERLAGSTPEGTVVRLAADAPAGSPAYEVTLRAAGPYRYYLATTVQPDASRASVEGVGLVHGSFAPVDARAGKGGGV